MNPRAAYSACPYCRKLLHATRCRPSSSLHEKNRGFSLTELLVAIAIIAILMSLSAVAVNAARNSQKVNQTRLTIDKLNRILTEQLRRYDSVYIAPTTIADAASSAGLTFPNGVTASQKRAWYIRHSLINGDMPDRWSDVAVVAARPQPPTKSQESYKKFWGRSLISPDGTGDRDSAECLFMIIMLSGFADCLDCGPMRSSEIGDTDNDGLPEFLDAWGNPIGFLLWAPGFELPIGTQFFSSLQNPWLGAPSPMLGMRPLIYSAGLDGSAGYNRGTETQSSLNLGTDCGNPYNAEFSVRGQKVGSTDHRRDNVTNFDSEVK